MKQASEPHDSVQCFPAILSKFQSGTLFTKSNLLSALSYSLNSPESSESLQQSLTSPKSFSSILSKFYEETSFNSQSGENALTKIEFLCKLFDLVLKKGGWSAVNGRNYWNELARHQEMQNFEGLRKDYDEFLFAFGEKCKNLNGELGFGDKSNLNPSFMKCAEFFRPFNNECELNSGMIFKFLQKSVFVIPCLSNLILNFSFDSSVELTDFLTTSIVPLSQYPRLYDDINSKLLSGIHWSSESNLLNYAQYCSLSSPQLVFLKSSPYYAGGKSFLSTFSIFLTLSGQADFFIISENFIEALKDKVKKLMDLDVFGSSWTPDEKFLLKNEIEFTYVKSYPGDATFIQADCYYWVVSRDAVMLNWFFLPDWRIKATCETFISTINQPHQFNLPLMAVEYLNRTLATVDNKVLDCLKNVILESIEDECWTGQYEQENIEIIFCVVCLKELFWRYAICNTCLKQGVRSGMCLKCINKHGCCDIEKVQKYSSVEFDVFLSYMENPAAGEIQKKLIKVNLPEPAGQQSVNFDPKLVLEYENVVETLANTQKLGDNEPVLKKQQSDESCKRKPMKKQKTGEGSEQLIILQIEEEYFERVLRRKNRRNSLKNFEKVKRRELVNGKKVLLEVDN